MSFRSSLTSQNRVNRLLRGLALFSRESLAAAGLVLLTIGLSLPHRPPPRLRLPQSAPPAEAVLELQPLLPPDPSLPLRFVRSDSALQANQKSN